METVCWIHQSSSYPRLDKSIRKFLICLFQQVWQDENNNELNDPTRFKFINYEQDPEKSGKYKLQLSVFNLTKDTFVKLLVTNSVDQQEALLTIKVMDENPESPPVAYAASMGKISIWIAIGILVLIVLVGYVIFRARKSIVCKATPEVVGQQKTVLLT